MHTAVIFFGDSESWKERMVSGLKAMTRIDLCSQFEGSVGAFTDPSICPDEEIL
jgi:hypothetical protein